MQQVSKQKCLFTQLDLKVHVEQFVAKFDHVKYLRDSQIEILNAQRNEKGLDTKLSSGGRDTENLSDYVANGTCN